MIRQINRPQAERLSPQDRKFYKTVYATDTEVYLTRLRALGLSGHSRVLDAGCGFGQWTLALAQLNHEVIGVDLDRDRVSTARIMARDHQVRNVRFDEASIEALPYPDASFDAVFSYSTIYHTRHRVSLLEMARVLRSQGRLYVNYNGVGWYLFLLLHRGVCALDGNNIRKGICGIINTVLGRAAIHAVGSRDTTDTLRQAGCDISAVGADGDIGNSGQAFYRGSYLGCAGVCELLARKR